MAIIITEDCIDCGACEPECPNHAIYPVGEPWRWSDGTALKEITAASRSEAADEVQAPLSNEVFYIVPGKCTECMGFHEEPQCAAVCPVDCCVDDPDHRETRERLLEKKEWLHLAA